MRCRGAARRVRPVTHRCWPSTVARRRAASLRLDVGSDRVRSRLGRDSVHATESGSAESAQPRFQVALEQLQETALVVPRGVEDEVVQTPVDVVLHLGDGLVRVGRDDPPLGDLLDGQRVGEALNPSFRSAIDSSAFQLSSLLSPQSARLVNCNPHAGPVDSPKGWSRAIPLTASTLCRVRHGSGADVGAWPSACPNRPHSTAHGNRRHTLQHNASRLQHDPQSAPSAL